VERREFFERAKAIVQKSLKKKDRLIVNAVHTVDDLNKEINQLSERLKDWYGISFPELESLFPDPEKYASIVLALEKNEKEQLLKLTSEEKLNQIFDARKDSLGAEITENDKKPILDLAKSILSTVELRSRVESYLESLCNELCPNVSYLCGPLLTARLLAIAGGLEELAEMPASTIQVLGAEKALFKHIKRGSPPPKHGLLFQHPIISGASKEKRGKIARALSAKIAIAAKADAFTHHFIADKLKADLEKRLSEIK